jgi:splicing factor U2AF 65 kDa subunit
MQAMDPFAAVRAKNKAQGLQVNNPLEVERARNEQQAKARQMVLQQQAISTAAAASKTQREVYIGNLQQVLATNSLALDVLSV